MWHYVYDMESMALFIFFDLNASLSTGNALLDAIVNFKGFFTHKYF